MPPDPAGKEDKRLLGFIPGRASFDVQSFRVSAGDLLSVLLINKEDPQEHNVAFLRSEDPEPFETAVRRWIAADPDSSRESG